MQKEYLIIRKKKRIFVKPSFVTYAPEVGVNFNKALKKKH